MIRKQRLIEEFPYHVVVVVSPHPDDSCIAVGGLLYRLGRELAGRCAVHVLVMTSGHRGVTDSFLRGAVADGGFPYADDERTRILDLLDRQRAGKLDSDDREFLHECRAAMRRREVECEAGSLGFTPHFLDLDIYEEHTLTAGDERTLSAKLAELRAAGPRRLLIVPGRHELHQTHRLSFDLVDKVVKERHAGEYEVWAYDSPWSAMMPRPDVVVPLTREALDAKVAATRCHKSQVDRTPYTGLVEGTAVKTAAVLSEWLGSFDVSRALDLGAYAEVFEKLTDSIVYE